jgi:hypothetical protein
MRRIAIPYVYRFMGFAFLAVDVPGGAPVSPGCTYFSLPLYDVLYSHREAQSMRIITPTNPRIIRKTTPRKARTVSPVTRSSICSSMIRNSRGRGPGF